jgi:hypothetical protein
MKTRETDKFLEQNPKMRQWVNECAACQRKGHKPETPEEANHRLLLYQLRRRFDLLELDENGLCEQCGFASGLSQSSG